MWLADNEFHIRGIHVVAMPYFKLIARLPDIMITSFAYLIIDGIINFPRRHRFVVYCLSKL